jgi:hypothetical protein
LREKRLRDNQDLGSPKIQTLDKILPHQVPEGNVCRRGRPSKETLFAACEFSLKYDFWVSWAGPKSKKSLKPL